MSKKLTAEEREKLAQKLIVADLDFDLNILGPSKKLRKSLKAPIEKVTNYQRVVGDSVFWASRQAYLELLQSFLSKKIDGETLTSKFFQLRSQDMMSTDELCVIIEDQILPIPDLYYTFKAKDFSSAIDDFFFIVEPFNPEIEEDEDNLDVNDVIYGEKTLRLSLQTQILPRLEEACGLDDSSFESKIHLERLVSRSYSIFFSVLVASGLVLVHFF